MTKNRISKSAKLTTCWNASAALLRTLSLFPIINRINQFNAIHKSCLHLISIYTRQNIMFNSDHFVKCRIRGVKTVLIHFQSRWAGYIRMIYERNPKILIYKQLQKSWKTLTRGYKLKTFSIPVYAFQQIDHIADIGIMRKSTWRYEQVFSLYKFGQIRLNQQSWKPQKYI